MNKYTSELSMPTFNKLIFLPLDLEKNSFLGGDIILRYFAPWGDGSRNGWQLPLSTPTVLVNGISSAVEPWFGYATNPSSYITGQVLAGFDQHAQYFQVYFSEVAPTQSGYEFSFSGFFQKAAYFSIAIRYGLQDKETGQNNNYQIEFFDNEMITEPSHMNPYLVGNPSVFSYQTSSSDIVSDILRKKIKAPNHPKKENLSGEINLYRVDRETSMSVVADELSFDGCSKGYLYATKSENQNFCILRIKLGSTFISSETPDVIFGDYDCREITVSSHVLDEESAVLDFWSISSLMLNDYVDNEGYSYVFFAPASYVMEQVTLQNTPSTQPPVIEWGKYKGYLLGSPEYAMIIRYRMPNKLWIGSPENAVCYLTPEDNQPVTIDELGDFCPQMFGGSYQDFLEGTIGSVRHDENWPIK